MKKLGKYPSGIYRLSREGTPTNEYAIILDTEDGYYACTIIQTDYKRGEKDDSFILGISLRFPERTVSHFTYMVSVHDWIDAGHLKFVTARELITWDLEEIEKQKYIMVKDYECKN